MKIFKAFETDFYQLSMIAAYIVNDKANDITGFEGFIRHIKPAVNSFSQFYIFDGETEIHEYMSIIKKEFEDPEFIETFLTLVMPKVTANKNIIENIIREKWKTIDKSFEYTVISNGTIVFPLVPVFQIKSAKWIGQLIETYITNIYNGRTGLATIKYLRDNNKPNLVTDEEFNFLERLMNNEESALNEYKKILDNTAKEFRGSTNKILLEAAFRRCPSKITADIASTIAIQNGWNGTSNVSVFLDNLVNANQIGGTMAHSWVMSFENERDAFIAWDKIFPGTTILIDTYNVINAANMIKEMVNDGIITAPHDVRIDSDPLDVYSKQVDEIFNETEISRVDNITGIRIENFVSGDMNLQKFKTFEDENIPYGKAMAGTKYCYSDKLIERLNSGFVYKIVEYINKDGKIIRPEKKATGKFNHSGLKSVNYDMLSNTLIVETKSSNFGFRGIENINDNTMVIFK